MQEKAKFTLLVQHVYKRQTYPGSFWKINFFVKSKQLFENVAEKYSRSMSCHFVSLQKIGTQIILQRTRRDHLLNWPIVAEQGRKEQVRAMHKMAGSWRKKEKNSINFIDSLPTFTSQKTCSSKN